MQTDRLRETQVEIEYWIAKQPPHLTRYIGVTMSHQPPKTSKKKPQHTPKEKKAIKQQKKHAADTAPFIKH